MRHCTREELARYRIDCSEDPRRAETEAHLEDCEECREQYQSLTRFEDGARDAVHWNISDEIRRHRQDRVPSSYLLQAHAIVDERANARELLDPLLTSPQRFQDAAVSDDPRFQNPGAVAILCEAARDLCERQPSFAAAVAKAALSIAKLLEAHGTPRSSSLLSLAEIETAAALFFTGEYREAESALTRAEAALGEDRNSNEWYLARVWLIRANIFVETDRGAQAGDLASASASQFAVFGDTKRFLMARVLEASLLFAKRKYVESAALAEDLIAEATARGIKVVRALAMQHAGAAYVALGNYSKAMAYLSDALVLWDELGFETERIRTHWWLATLFLQTGDFEAGIRGLDETYRAFHALGVTNDEALARMELAEALLAAGRPEDVPDLLSAVVVRFASEGLMRKARIALGYIHEALRADSLSVELIRDVRIYLEDLPFRPTATFSPLR